MIEEHFRHRIEAFGLDSDGFKVHYRLGYCQGDGMAFYGRMDFETIKTMFDRYAAQPVPACPVQRVKNLLNKNELELMMRVMAKYGQQDLTIETIDHHYSHWNTMRVRSEDYFPVMIWDDDTKSELSKDLGIKATDETLQRWQTIWDGFIETFQEAIQQLSKELEREGYALIEAFSREDEVVWERSTKNYIVRVLECGSGMGLDMGQEYDPQTAEALIVGKAKVVNLKAQVLSKEDDDVLLAEGQLGDCYTDVDDITYGDMRREVLHEAIQEYRDMVAKSNERNVGLKVA